MDIYAYLYTSFKSKKEKQKSRGLRVYNKNTYTSHAHQVNRNQINTMSTRLKYIHYK
jgi:hypothetical protein